MLLHYNQNPKFLDILTKLSPESSVNLFKYKNWLVAWRISLQECIYTILIYEQKSVIRKYSYAAQNKAVETEKSFYMYQLFNSIFYLLT